MKLVRLFQLAAPLALCLAATACEDPAKDKPRATVAPTSGASAAAAPTGAANLPLGASSAAAAATPTVAAAAAAPTGAGVPIDVASSTVGFIGSKVTGKHEGKFEKFSGTLSPSADGKAEGGQVTIEIDMNSVKTDEAKLDGHLKSPDLFDTTKFPTAKFVSTEIKAGGDKGATHTVTGDLDLHGVKKSISFPATVTVSDAEITAKTEFVLNRKDFSIIYPGKPDDAIRDDVVIKFDVKAPRKK
ncbi:YceI family protein [Chondromyces apiculatus]|uniref:Rhodanese-like domain protein n=1 Tax=Chondromyces apiculatus DSM 436 TaxID=1192034 RepID=A0A017TJJ4_9BACT|nr:YceI family protein [Chondromyces apiculatus]EYF08816.1 Rhodanese-like domain protein [Chondromyces apiculatus DSM 436]